MKLNVLVLTFNMTAGFLKIKHLFIAVAIVTYIKNSEHYLEYIGLFYICEEIKKTL